MIDDDDPNYLESLAQEYKSGKNMVCRSAVDRILAAVKERRVKGEYSSKMDVVDDFIKLYHLEPNCKEPKRALKTAPRKRNSKSRSKTI